MKPVFFDSNILVYAHNGQSPFFLQAKSLQEKVVWGKLLAAIAPQNLLEFYSTVTNKNKFEKPLTFLEAKKACQIYLTSGFLIIYPKQNDIEAVFSLAAKRKIIGRRIFDVYLVVTMLSNGIKTIYTANERDFEIFREIKVVNPFK